MKRKMEEIETKVKHMTCLLEDVLTIGKNDSIKMRVMAAPVDIRSFALSVCQELELSAKSSHRVILSVDDFVPVKINADEKLLRNIFINLISNAIKYSPGRNQVNFDIHSNQNELRFSVADKGSGMHPEELNKIFEPFYRCQSTEDIQGTGLGLSIVKRAADLINAKVTVNSALDEGTVFHVVMPR
jgi:signal transduction histidine kinase